MLVRTVVGVETTGDLGSVAVLTGEREVVRSFAPGRRHSANLLPELEAARREAGAGWGDGVLLSAARGPGSFTGLRVGLATVQGLALAHQLPAVGVSALDAAALGQPAGERVLVVVDALRGELFGAVYQTPAGADDVVAEAGPFRLRPEQTPALAAQHRVTRIAGPGVARRLAALAGANPDVVLDDAVAPLAAAVAAIGRKRFAAGTEAPLAPIYLREPDAVPRSRYPVAAGHR